MINQSPGGIGATAAQATKKFFKRSIVKTLYILLLVSLFVQNSSGQCTITSHPTNASASIGGGTSYSVSATGPSITYQWAASNGSGFVALTNGGTYSGVTSPTLNVSNISPSMSCNQYRCTITGSGCSFLHSNPATLSISSLPTINITSTTNNICIGGAILFSAQVSPINISVPLQWYVNNIPTGKGSTFSANSLKAGDVIKCAMDINCMSTVPVMSNTITMTKNVDKTVTKSNDTLTVNATNGIYQWLDCNNNYAPINGQSNKFFVAVKSGNYAVSVTQNGCTDTSACYSVTKCLPSDTTIIDTGCNNYVLNGITYDSTDIYTQKLLNASGCDSTITLNLTVKKTKQIDFNIPIVDNCGDNDIKLIESLLSNPTNAERWDYHSYQVETVICDASNYQGSKTCSKEDVWNFIKNNRVYQVPQYDDFQYLWDLVPSCIKNSNSDTGSAYTPIYQAVLTEEIDSNSLNVPLNNCEKILIPPTLTRRVGGLLFLVDNIHLPTRIFRIDCQSNLDSDPIRIVIDEPNYRIINYTQTGHFLHPGKIERYVVEEDCGIIKVITRGIGFTTCGDNLIGLMIANTNVCIGEQTFKHVDMRLKADFNK